MLKTCNTLNYELERLLPKGKDKKVIGFMEDKLGKKIMQEIVGLRANHIAIQKTTTMKIKRERRKNFKFVDYKNCLEATQKIS